MQTAFERRQEILSILNIRRHDTMPNLAFEFEVSIRTIERDIAALSLKYPIYTVQGNAGGVHMIDGASAGRKYLSEEQATLLQRLTTSLTGADLVVMNEIIKNFAVRKREGGNGRA